MVQQELAKISPSVQGEWGRGVGQHEVRVYLPSTCAVGIATAVTTERMVSMLKNLYIDMVDVAAVSLMGFDTVGGGLLSCSWYV